MNNSYGTISGKIGFTSKKEFLEASNSLMKRISEEKEEKNKIALMDDLKDLLFRHHKEFDEITSYFQFEDVIEGFHIHVRENYSKYEEERNELLTLVRAKEAHTMELIDRIHKFIDKYFEDGDLLNSLGVLYTDEGQLNKGLAYYHAALHSKNPPFRKIYNNLTSYYYSEAVTRIKEKYPYQAIYYSLYKTLEYHKLMIENVDEGYTKEKEERRNKIIEVVVNKIRQIIYSKNLYSYITKKYDEETAKNYFIDENYETIVKDYNKVLEDSQKEVESTLKALSPIKK